MPDADASNGQWYIVKQLQGHCDVVSSTQFDDSNSSNADEQPAHWGPFNSQAEAIARRVGLIRAGKCQPV